MATFTAQMLIGTPHPNHGGIEPTHFLFLSENSRPAWILLPENVFGLGVGSQKKITWIPTVEHMLEDALLMIAIHVIQDETICGLAQKYIKSKDPLWVELYKDIDEQKLVDLHLKCREIPNRYKAVISVLKGSSISNQLSIIEDYHMDVEVCVPTYSRLYSQWKGESVVTGKLDR